MFKLKYCPDCKTLFIRDYHECKCGNLWTIDVLHMGNIKHAIQRLICKIFGHKWTDIDHGDQDSGYIGVKCERCGESHGQILY